MITKWTKEHEGRLVELNDQRISMSKIAEILNKEFGLSLTRSAVSGKKSRMGLSDTKVSQKGTKSREIRRKPKAFEGGKSLADAGHNDCRFMCLENDNICGKPIYKKSLCEQHYDMCWIKSAKKPVRKVKKQ